MLLPEVESHPSSPPGTPQQSSETVYICFHSVHIVLRFSVPEILLSAVSIFGTMLSPTPIGTQAGAVEIGAGPGGICICEDGVTGEELFSTPAAAARDMYHRAVKQLIASTPELVWVHGGVVANNGQALLFSGPSGQGKSTLVAHFVSRGWTYLSDELAPIDPRTATVLPFPIMPYRRDSQRSDLAVEEVRVLGKIAVELTQESIGRSALPLAGIYFLSYAPTGASVQISDCPPALAVVEMLRNSLNPGESRTEEISNLCHLIEKAPAKYLRYTSAADAAAEVVRTCLI